MAFHQGLYCAVLVAALALPDTAMAHGHLGAPEPGASPSHHRHTLHNPWATTQAADEVTGSANDTTTEANWRESSGITQPAASDTHVGATSDGPTLTYPTNYVEEVVQKLGLKGSHLDFVPFGGSEGTSFGVGMGKGAAHHSPMLMMQWGLP